MEIKGKARFTVPPGQTLQPASVTRTAGLGTFRENEDSRLLPEAAAMLPHAKSSK